MEEFDIVEDILFSIEKDELEEFKTSCKKLKDWKSYELKEEKEKLIHYAISKNIK